MSDLTRDKYGRKIEKHELLKAYHFTGARRKKYYLYKYVLGDTDFSNEYFKISSLSYCGHEYSLSKFSGVLKDYEIIQGKDLEEREKE